MFHDCRDGYGDEDGDGILHVLPFPSLISVAGKLNGAF